MSFPELDQLERLLSTITAPTSVTTTAPAAEDLPIPDLITLADVPAKSITWLWPRWLPAGMLSILGGHVGDGKSTVIAAIAAALTTGAPLPDGHAPEPVNVLFLSTEDDPARVIRPRLAANNADLNRVFIMEATARLAPTAPARVNLTRDAARLRTLIEDHDIRLIIIDPVSSLLPRSDRASEGAIRDSLLPLMQLIEETGVAVLGVMRVGKTLRNNRPAQRLVGSSAFPAIARSVLMLARTPADHGTDDDATGAPSAAGRAILEVVKSNYALPPQPVALTIEDTGAVHWHGATETGIDDAIAEPDPQLTRTVLEEATAFLLEYLEPGPDRASNVFDLAKRLGFSEITLRRAKKRAGIKSCRGTFNAWYWHLPGADLSRCQAPWDPRITYQPTTPRRG